MKTSGYLQYRAIELQERWVVSPLFLQAHRNKKRVAATDPREARRFRVTLLFAQLSHVNLVEVKLRLLCGLVCEQHKDLQPSDRKGEEKKGNGRI